MVPGAGNGRATNRRRHGLAISRAQRLARLTRALSVAMPVFAYICRYSFEISTNASRARSVGVQRERTQMRRQAVEPIPHGLRPRADLVGRHHRMRRVDLRPLRLRDQPVARDRNAGRRASALAADALLPRLEVHGARIRASA